VRFSLPRRRRQCELRQERLRPGRTTFGLMVTGAGTVFATNGYPGAGSCVRVLLPFMSKAIGSAGQEGGSGFRVTGSKKDPEWTDRVYPKTNRFARRPVERVSFRRAWPCHQFTRLIACLAGGTGDSLSGLCGVRRVQRVIAISAFTTLREEAAGIVGGPLSHLLIESYDNRATVVEFDNGIRKRKSRFFPGRNDDVIPVRMAQELPFIDFFAMEGATT
jgi:hypothetical protein